MPAWHLEELSEMAETHKYTFYRPSPDAIAKVRVGEEVKLFFLFESDEPGAPRAERMWVEVESITSTGEFVGRLRNDPHYIKGLAYDDLVSFDQRHIASTEHDDPNNLVARYSPFCLVSNRVLREGTRVGYLYRVDPDNDSGWRITAGDETDEYVDDQHNIALVSLGAVLNCDDSILPLLDAPSGSAFVRNPVTGMFVAVS